MRVTAARLRGTGVCYFGVFNGRRVYTRFAGRCVVGAATWRRSERLAMSSAWLTDVVSGLCGAACLVGSGSPFDTAKVRMQTMPGAYRNSVECILQMARSEGVASLWKGASPALLSAMIENAVVFSANGFLRRLVAAGADEASITPGQQAVIGGCAGVFSAAAICPAEVIKCRMQYQSSAGHTGEKRYRNTLHCAATIVREEGALALFSGLRALWARDIPFNFLFFGCYRLCCVGLSRAVLGSAAPAHHDIPGWMAMIGGGMAGGTAWALIYPFDVLKSRAQVAGMLSSASTAPLNASLPTEKAGSSALGSIPGPGAPDGHQSMRSTLQGILRRQGVRGLYSGASAAIARGSIANGALFWGQNMATKLLRSAMQVDSATDDG